ncbi:MAG: dihydroorotase [Cryomorphaceae bacterium]|nr:dihydroorotase [Cryomorphaceae bacterium]
MTIFIKSVKVVDSGSPYHGKTVDIRFDDGAISAIGNLEINEGDQVVSQDGLCISPGWIDLHVDFADPGEEEREDIESGIAAAIAGGFTGAVLMPSTNPVIDSKSQVEYVRKKAEHLPFYLYPAGALSRQMAGEELAEMYDMHRVGARCFTDDKKSHLNAGFIKLALEYTQQFAAPLFLMAQEPSMVKGGQMHEGEVSTRLGLKGMPSTAEVMQVERDLQLLKYAGGHIHFMGISTAAAVEVIARAKDEGLQVTADVNIANLVLNDESLVDYDANYKFYPPLRTEADRLALIEGLRKGIIDAVSSDHRPNFEETKKCEFSLASFGSIGLESCFGLLGKTGLSVEDRVDVLSRMPRGILNLPEVVVDKGHTAQYTLFLPEEKWTFNKLSIQSKSKNTPFIGESLIGKVYGVIVDDTLITVNKK